MMTVSLATALVASLDDDALEVLADRLAPRLRDRLGYAKRDAQRLERAGYLRPAAAGAYLGVSRKRVYDLKSAGAIAPDGYDGRTPLFRRETLDAYVGRCGR